MIEIKQYTNYNKDEIIKLYTAVGWSNYYENPKLLEQAFLHSLYTLGAYDEDKLIGIVRVVGDGHTIIFIQDLLVFPEYQGKKIGTDLMNKILEKYNDIYQIHLATDNTEKTVNFYKSLGLIEFSKKNYVGFTK